MRGAKPKSECIIHGCREISLCRYWCRYHYNQMYRCGRIKPRRAKNPSGMPSSVPTIELQLERTRQIYAAAWGVQCRLKWWKKVQLLERELAEVKERERIENDS